MRFISVIVFALITSVVVLGYSLADAMSVNSVQTHTSSPGELAVTLSGSGFHKDHIKVFSIDGHEPRIVVDLMGGKSRLVSKGPYRNKQVQGLRAIRAAQKSVDTLRIVLDLEFDNHFLEAEIEPDEVKVLIKTDKPHQNDQVNISVSEQSEDENTLFVNLPVPRLKPERSKKPVVVIDAGHGGRDPGAIGVGGVYEKTITLSAAIELRNQLQATGRYKVVMSRSSDVYVEHETRLKIARINGADLFISIHADSIRGNTARGASVYTLADRAKGRSKGIVNNQNWIMDVDLTEQNDNVGDILVDLAQRTTLSQSAQFADILIDELKGKTKLVRNTHRRAGYYVLLAPDVPAVLFELGFLSNPEDEKLLKIKSHRRKLMYSVTAAINSYFDRQKS